MVNLVACLLRFVMAQAMFLILILTIVFVFGGIPVAILTLLIGGF